ncbi:hypothetical protein PV10_03325 [Exophiala mesophila]|uniref:Uncharacterized protein n=1 Tax=Exophiala mesophila TaxID=212818 RepID=A0A0D2A9R0_EXOME|nr:uncharacterized protein PV10_03325 [Exophiala mesophila]KIV95703.1 hypothetical protein PV10_03325 [Exophiala mesophila]
MASLISRNFVRAASSAAKSPRDTSFVKQGAKRDPELYILLGVMSGAFGLAGFYFGRKPTSASSEADVSVANSSMPWEVEHDESQDESKDFKYQYHPKGDRSQTPKNAPSALNTVIVPNVTLPKEIHDQFNKWGKDSDTY